VFVHTTCAPLGIVIVAGSKAYWLFCSTILTWNVFVDDVGLGAAVELDTDVATGVELDGVLLVCVPQAASTNIVVAAVSRKVSQQANP